MILFYGVSALIFAASAAVTIVWCASMSSIGGMTMPGGWVMAMTWMRMPGQTWPGATASFVGMWLVMMVAMMLPSLVPMLMRYRAALVPTTATRLGLLTTTVAFGYFAVWTLFGLAIYPVGMMLAEIEMRQPAVSRAVPFAGAVAIMIAGVLQFTAWKARHLECCRHLPPRGVALSADAATAWRHGMRLGLHCGHTCAGPMLFLLVIGVMDLRAMAAVTAAITIERFAPASQRAAHAIGVVIVATGFVQMIQNLADLI